MSIPTPLQALLLDCLHQDQTRLSADRVAALDEDQWRQLVALARMHRVRRRLQDRLSRSGFKTLAPASVWSDLREECRLLALGAIQQQAELAGMVRALTDVGIPVVVLKGAYLREAVYRDPAFREMTDIDIMVPREHLQQTSDIVVARGYESGGLRDVAIWVNVANHLPRCVKPGVAAVEVHWNLTNPGQPYSIEPEGLFQRAVPLEVSGATALALSPEDALLHLCLHASYQDQFEFGLRPACDVAAVIERFGKGINWEAVRRRAGDWQWTRGVYAVLRVARELIGADVPSGVLQAMRPDDWSEEILATIRAQIFTARSELVELAPSIARLGGAALVGGRLRYVYGRIFVSPLEAALYFSLPVNSSPGVLAWRRLRRLLPLIRRHSRSAARLLARRDAGLVSVAERKNQLGRWLARP